MPLFMDIHHDVDGDVEEIAAGHLKDLEVQEKYGVRYLSYWFNQQGRSVCCLIEAPNAAAASNVHIEAHGAAADKVIEVEPAVVEAFLGGSVDAGLGRMVGLTGKSEAGFRTVLFTDIEDSTGMTQRLGDAESRKVVRVHDQLVRQEVEAHGGRVLKHTGDGYMAAFSACSAAIRAATKIQRRLSEYNDGMPSQPLRVRIGISAGEPVDEGEDLFGTAVLIARRLCDAAPPECVYVANVVRELCAGKEFRFTDVGTQSLKGFADPIDIYEVLWMSGGDAV